MDYLTECNAAVQWGPVDRRAVWKGVQLVEKPNFKENITSIRYEDGVYHVGARTENSSWGQHAQRVVAVDQGTRTGS